MKLSGLIQDMAKNKGVTPSQLALSWVLRQPDVVAIPGTKQVHYVEENWGANFVELTVEERKILRSFLTTFNVAGERYWKNRYPIKN